MCFKFLVAMSRDYTVVQERLFERLTEMLALRNAEAYVAELFIEV